MSRNMNALSNKIICELCRDTGYDCKSFSKTKIFLTQEQYKSVSEIQLKAHYKFDYESMFSIYQNGDDLFLLISGVFDIGEQESLTLVDNSVILSLPFIADSGLQKKVSIDENYIKEYVFVIDYKSEEIGAEQVLDCFPSIKTYIINDNITGQESISLNRYVIFACCNSPVMLRINFATSVLDAFADVANYEEVDFPYENIIASITSAAWKFTFLDIYRCIERLFHFGFLEEHHSKFSSNADLPNFKDAIKGIIVPRERDNIKFLLQLLPEEITNIVKPLCGTKTVSNYIYDLRNSIVHYSEDNITKEDADWNSIVLYMLRASLYLHSHYKDYFDTFTSCELFSSRNDNQDI